MEKTLYERLGGIFSIAAVTDYFSDNILTNPKVGTGSPNPDLQEWSTHQLNRLPGLKFMRTLWICNVSGGPFQYVATKPGSTVIGLENAHKDLHISPEEFDAVAGELAGALDHFNVPITEKNEVLSAFNAHKDEVTMGYRESIATPSRVGALTR